MTDKERRIREAAYRVWEEEGRPEGQASRHWTTAAQRIDAEDLKNARPAPESDESAEQMALATRTIRGKAGSSGTAAGANSKRAAAAEPKSPGRALPHNDRPPLSNR
jgi:hypothetical protein